MKTFDDATEQYIARLLDDAPPLDPEQAALVIRTFARTATDHDLTAPTAA